MWIMKIVPKEVEPLNRPITVENFRKFIKEIPFLEGLHGHITGYYLVFKTQIDPFYWNSAHRLKQKFPSIHFLKPAWLEYSNLKSTHLFHLKSFEEKDDPNTDRWGREQD